MLKAAIIGLVALVIGVLTWKNRRSSGRSAEGLWSVGILAIGAVYAIGYSLRMPIPNPVDLISFVFHPVYKPIVDWLGIQV
ncbi:CHASE2 domain-containing sensor protein [Paenibacillus phyllosphaerae]|uniref:CHASE2 domain-containing sensor protein n=1 Tax=Paenibacillus phyllosphaerae TaxID=274593 RepID=A0A7W5AVL3_9BACL|nr:hypothetical protein [Paenibacillus phyllosphaerae]MBB3109595.1 CHASE2 domain-containing sensor protein [Paenibacillus phyllosphaerae]